MAGITQRLDRGEFSMVVLHLYRVYDGVLRHHNSRYGEVSINEFLTKGFTLPTRPKDILIDLPLCEACKLPNHTLVGFCSTPPLIEST